MFGIFPNITEDQYGFGPPANGGVGNWRTFAFAYNTTGISSGVSTTFSIPANAEIVYWGLLVKTVFNAETTNVLSVGDQSSATKYLNANTTILTVAGPTYSTAWVATQMATQLTTESIIKVTYTQTGTAATAGNAVLTCCYITR